MVEDSEKLVMDINVLYNILEEPLESLAKELDIPARNLAYIILRQSSPDDIVKLNLSFLGYTLVTTREILSHDILITPIGVGFSNSLVLCMELSSKNKQGTFYIIGGKEGQTLLYSGEEKVLDELDLVATKKETYVCPFYEPFFCDGCEVNGKKAMQIAIDSLEDSVWRRVTLDNKFNYADIEKKVIDFADNKRFYKAFIEQVQKELLPLFESWLESSQ